MNSELIKQLAEQAGFQYIKEDGIGWAGNHSASLPKFAELIIEECARESDKQTIYCKGIPWGKWIKDHFQIL
jgi:hypothetical protein